MSNECSYRDCCIRGGVVQLAYHTPRDCCIQSGAVQLACHTLRDCCIRGGVVQFACHTPEETVVTRVSLYSSHVTPVEMMYPEWSCTARVPHLQRLVVSRVALYCSTHAMQRRCFRDSVEISVQGNIMFNKCP